MENISLSNKREKKIALIPWVEKYRPKTILDIKGQKEAIEEIKKFLKDFPKKRAVILNGPPGSGKTTAVIAIAKDLDYEILELNASDIRNSTNLKITTKPASMQESLFKKSKIILLDEVDGITDAEKGGLEYLKELISQTGFPILMTSNDIWQKKFSELRKMCRIIKFESLNYKDILEILKRIVKKEKLSLSDDILISLAVKSKGDVRAAINDLQSLSFTNYPSEMYERDKEESIFNVLRVLFKSVKADKDTINILDTTNLSTDEIFLWIDENLPKEYDEEDLVKAYQMISRADIFRGRVTRRQHWRFLVYENIFLSAGIMLAKKQAKIGFTSYNRPSRILKIWIINQKNKWKKEIAKKFARITHKSVKYTLKNFNYIKNIIKNYEVMKKLGLNEEEKIYLRSL